MIDTHGFEGACNLMANGDGTEIACTDVLRDQRRRGFSRGGRKREAGYGLKVSKCAVVVALEPRK